MKISLDDFFTCNGCKPGRHFVPSCSEEIARDIRSLTIANQSALSTLSTVLVYTNFMYFPQGLKKNKTRRSR